MQIGAPIEERPGHLKTADVAVATHELETELRYLVTFTSLGTPANLGNCCCSPATAPGPGDAAASVRKISTGCCDVALSFNNGNDWHSKQGLAHGPHAIVKWSLQPSFVSIVAGGTAVTVTIAGGLLLLFIVMVRLRRLSIKSD